MTTLLNKGRLLALIALSCVMTSSLAAWDGCNCESSRFYIGAFGGGLYSNSTKVIQQGTLFFTEAEGGLLAVLAEGHTKKKSTGFGGVQVGYEWSICNPCTNWVIAPAFELEACFFSHKKRGHLINNTDRLPEHDFLDSFHMSMDTLLVNAVFSVSSCCWCGISPYVGGGIGATRISIRHATSLQTDPVELGINHFNSRRHDSSWAFTGQVKAGLRYSITKSLHVFGEYRYIFVDSSNYIFGSTVDPTHVPSSPWNVKIENIHYNAFAIGFQYDFW